MAARIPDPKFSKPSGIKEAKHLPKPYKMRRYYTPAEVAVHNTADNCWVSFFDEVYDLTLLIQQNCKKSKLCEPLIQAAGTDITHWFD
jgi:cytochrome b involved in lipid metabolism